MTGHDLDLEACKRIPHPVAKVLVAEVESLHAKLAAAEQERDLHRDHAARLKHIMDVDAGQIGAVAARADRAERALAAVREAARPLMKWVEFHTANYSGNPPNRRLAISYEAAPVTFADVQAFVAALAAAEQDEPKREQS